MANFSTILKRLREQLELTQEQLATKLDISRSRLASYEQGSREPDLEMLEIFADFFNVDIDYLVGRSDKTTRLIEEKEITTLAAHADKDLTGDEIKAVEDYIKFLKSKRK